jgi:alginate O-acetyltransferase complex protein AlgI
MVFSSLTFLYFFLPAAMALTAITPSKYRSIPLLCASLVFYGWLDPSMLLLLLAVIAISFASARMMDKTDDPKRRKVLFILSVSAVCAFLIWFKYANFIFENIKALLHLDISFGSVALPLGISFYTFQALSYMADVYQKKITAEKNFIVYAAYISMFPQLVAGPIVRFEEVKDNLQNMHFSLENIAKGSGMFVCGLCKKVLIANQLAAFCEVFRQTPGTSVLYCWANAFATFFYIYYDFSGYTDMARGMGCMMGFSFPKNFDYPLLAGSFTGFWRRWHMSLTSWFRDYVYIPLGGNRKGKWITLRNLLIVWLLTGLWHGAAWNFVLWGLLFFALLSMERFVLPEAVKKNVLYRIFTIIGILISFLLFQDDSISLFVSDVQNLFGAGNLAWSSEETLYSLQSGAVLFVIAICGQFPVWKKLYDRLSQNTLFFYLMPFLQCALLLLCTAWIVSGSLNPFLYFRF